MAFRITRERRKTTGSAECMTLSTLEEVKQYYASALQTALSEGREEIELPLVKLRGVRAVQCNVLETALSVFRDFQEREEMQITLVVPAEQNIGTTGTVLGKWLKSVETFLRERLPKPAKKSDHGYFAMARTARSAAVPMAEMEDAAPMQGMMMGSAARSLEDIVTHTADTWQESLLHLIDEKGYTDTEVYKRANIDRKLFSKIRSNPAYQPKKITAVSFALALRLNLDETKDLIGRAGYALSPSSVFDLIIEYFIEQGVYDTYTINLALFQHEQPLLGE